MSNCSICGEPMPPGEEMFKFHGYSGSCPKPPLPSFVSVMAIALDDAAYLRDLAAYIDPVYKRRLTEIAAKLDHAKADSAAEIADLRYRLEVAERDADAFRLMARLNINVSYRENVNGAWVIAEHEGIDFCPESLDGPHEYDATRSAILRAAAAIEEPK